MAARGGEMRERQLNWRWGLWVFPPPHISLLLLWSCVTLVQVRSVWPAAGISIGKKTVKAMEAQGLRGSPVFEIHFGQRGEGTRCRVLGSSGMSRALTLERSTSKWPTTFYTELRLFISHVRKLNWCHTFIWLAVQPLQTTRWQIFSCMTTVNPRLYWVPLCNIDLSQHQKRSSCICVAVSMFQVLYCIMATSISDA